MDIPGFSSPPAAPLKDIKRLASAIKGSKTTDSLRPRSGNLQAHTVLRKLAEKPSSSYATILGMEAFLNHTTYQ